MTSCSTAANWQSKILKKEYQNWLAVSHALSLMCDGLRPFIEREMKAFHQVLMANLTSTPPCTCRNPLKHSCAWATQLLMYHRGGKPNSPRWRQSDSYKWTDSNLGYWEVAKLFMSDLGNSAFDVIDASSTDCTGLTNLLFWCSHFPVQHHLVEEVRKTRNNRWGHAPRQELTDGEKANALTAIRNLLQDPNLISDNNAKAALAEIDAMEKDFDARSIERKVLADFQETVCGQLDDIEGEITAFKKDCKGVSNKVQKKLLSLQTRQTKVFKLLKSIDDRKEDAANRNLSFVTQVSNLVKWVYTSGRQFVHENVRSMNANSLTLWLLLMVLLNCCRCLSKNSYNDGKF